MYHTLLGADGFRKGMDLYFERHDGSAVTCDDFRAAMADANNVSHSCHCTTCWLVMSVFGHCSADGVRMTSPPHMIHSNDRCYICCRD
jgi:hypothetical protein